MTFNFFLTRFNWIKSRSSITYISKSFNLVKKKNPITSKIPNMELQEINFSMRKQLYIHE